MKDCIFCKIIAGEIPSEIIYKNDGAVAFRDTSPQAPVHVLVVPKKHIPRIDSPEASEPVIAESLFKAVADISAKLGLKDGYRVVVNSGKHGGQTVGHLHLHILGGRQMGWPPG
ncbi:MAG: histidine triad nucleotide-binding protein [Candidatus Riflebacteria bacterium]|nr:histidine triad nucleotide-binding protein [Candidatus Riflebacteria bacterium]